jgi:hypothetical protein
MTTVFFKINDVQEKELKQMMNEEGYTNKAEFFRFLIKFYKYNKSPAQQNFEFATKELATVLKKLDKKGMLPSSLDEQLADV